ncbi:MAG: DUF2029 domain-containing protein [Parvularculaceae bacterium]|nr:DUF2029 domain-containing protein [Parvularculaceae bacterium]
MQGLVDIFARRYPPIYNLLTARLRLTLLVLASIFAVTAYTSYIGLVLGADGLFTRAGPMIGGDFVVFHTAGGLAGAPDAVGIYQLDRFAKVLEEAYPGHGPYDFGWQYPPTMFLIAAPFGALPFTAGFAAWVAVFASLFALTMRALWRDPGALALIMASPCIFLAVITGQTGLLTASLVALAAAFADRRPILAGVAAGLLTVKPQLGLLIPLAFAFGGCWRAFFAAAVTAITLALASFLAHGGAPWSAFIDAMGAIGGAMSDGAFPIHKLATPYGAMSLVGAPQSAAILIQMISSLALAVYVAIVWRRTKVWELRLIALATSALLATPYGLYYEFPVILIAMAMIAKLGVETGWLKFERIALIALWAAPLMTPAETAGPSIPVYFLMAFGAFWLGARRTLPAPSLNAERAPLHAGA